MKVVLLTQDSPLFVAQAIENLIKLMPIGSEISGSILFSAGLPGKQNKTQQLIKTWKVFGTAFTLRYLRKFIIGKLFSRSTQAILKKHNIPFFSLTTSINSNESLSKIKQFQPDLLISIVGNQIFKKPLIELAPKGCLNLHTAPLPKYRGVMPTFWQMKNNETQSAASVFFVDEGIDSGKILVQKPFNIRGLTLEECITKGKSEGIKAVCEAIRLIMQGEYVLKPNPDEQMTYFSSPTREDILEFKRGGNYLF